MFVATILAVLIAASGGGNAMHEVPFAGCLPADVQLGDIVEAHVVDSFSGDPPPVVEKVTVEQKLTALQARCRDGKLVDGFGKEIRFYRLIGCWGNPPYNYQDILQRQQEEINTLKERYTVIEMTCNPSGLPIQ